MSGKKGRPAGNKGEAATVAGTQSRCGVSERVRKKDEVNAKMVSKACDKFLRENGLAYDNTKHFNKPYVERKPKDEQNKKDER